MAQSPPGREKIPHHCGIFPATLTTLALVLSADSAARLSLPMRFERRS
jgi:hypothetical protein